MGVKIKIVAGTFGLQVSDKTQKNKKKVRIVPKTPLDEPFEVDEKTATRLIARKVAVLALTDDPSLDDPSLDDPPSPEQPGTEENEKPPILGVADPV